MILCSHTEPSKACRVYSQERSLSSRGQARASGAPCAIAFASEGAECRHCRSYRGGRSRAESRQSSSLRGRAELRSFHRTDVGRWEDIDRLIGSAVARYGRLDVMVNNAAIYSGTALLDTSSAQWEQVMRVNLTGMFNGCKRAIQQMINAGAAAGGTRTRDQSWDPSRAS